MDSLEPYCFQQLGFLEDKTRFLQNICVTLKLLDERNVKYLAVC
jgi:hypothetical protein